LRRALRLCWVSTSTSTTASTSSAASTCSSGSTCPASSARGGQPDIETRSRFGKLTHHHHSCALGNKVVDGADQSCRLEAGSEIRPCYFFVESGKNQLILKHSLLDFI